MLLLLFFLAGGLLAFASPVLGQPGFISIDCGWPRAEDSTYRDSITNIEYSPDLKYINTGINNNISSDLVNVYRPRYWDLRSFPEGNRNCYTLFPVRNGNMYLIRACFLYGNYDGLNSPPEFDLYIGTSLWVSLTFSSPESSSYCKEIITVASKDFFSVCLVKKGNSTPFISVLELRPLDNTMYSAANNLQSLALIRRRDVGSAGQVRYPDDTYDRIWEGWDYLTSMRTPYNVQTNDFKPPSAVMETASMPTNVGDSLSFYWTGENSSEYFIFMHFAELELLNRNQSRAFNINFNGDCWFGPVIPPNMSTRTVYSSTSMRGHSKYEFAMEEIENSTHPPILNAFEIYTVRSVSKLVTHKHDVDAIMDIKRVYNGKRNWMGDPCLPKDYPWDGLECNYDGSNPPRIISLNLSSAGLTGEIAASLANLTSLESLDLSNNNLTGGLPDFLAELQSLQSLDLSNNNLIGGVPDFFAELQSLQSLNISRNQLEGGMPKALLERSRNGLFTLSFDHNPDLFVLESHKKKGQNILLVIIISSVSAAVALLFIFVIIAWRKHRARLSRQSNPTYGLTHGRKPSEKSLRSQNRNFTYSEVVHMTNNFEIVIGAGGFGRVYDGFMTDSTHVAIKLLSKSSTQGSKEFTNEVQLLMRVHHRNLVSLIGYCEEGKEMALIYEYMVEGNLKQHLSGMKSNEKALDWGQRLLIAIDVAQGLEYLHSGCKPPIIHRDVKPENILLNERLEAKIGDFGLSKFFLNEELTHMYTTVKGTRGYLDPEYYSSQKLNEKSDVYSFGIILLELITGQPAIIKSTSFEKMGIVDWVRPIIESGDIGNLVDPWLQGDYSTNSAWKAIEIAMACTAPISIQRPIMRDVVTELKDCLSLGINSEKTLSIKNEVLEENSTFNPLPR